MMKKWPKSFEISSEIAKISTRSGEILPDLAKNLTRSSQKTSQNSQDLSNNVGIFVGWLDRVSRILKKENRHLTCQSRVLQEAIRRRLSERSVRSAVGWVRSIKAGGLSPAIDWTTLGGGSRGLHLQKKSSILLFFFFF